MSGMVTVPFSCAEESRGEPLRQRRKLAGQSWGIWHLHSCRMQLLVALEDLAGTSRTPSPEPWGCTRGWGLACLEPSTLPPVPGHRAVVTLLSPLSSCCEPSTGVHR